jgi:hypothetical protein
MTQSVRDRADGSRETYVREFAAEIQAARKAAEDADPLLRFQAAANAAAEATRENILTTRLSEEFLPGERIAGRKVDENVAAQNFKTWVGLTPSFKKWMADVFLDALSRNDLAPIADNFDPLHKLLIEYGCYPEEPVALAPVVEAPTYTKSEQAILDHQRYVEEIVGHDEQNTAWTEEMLDRLPADLALRLRRLFETGMRGNNRLREYMNRQDEKARQAADTNRIAAEEETI